MSKFVKRLRKIKKFPLYAIVIGDNPDDINDLLECFQSVFVIFNNGPKIRAKNIIYIEDMKQFPETKNIDMIFVNDSEKFILSNLVAQLRQCRPLIFVRSDITISKEQTEFFDKFRYHVTDFLGNYQIWKING